MATSGADLLKYSYRLNVSFVDSLILVNKDAWDKLTPATRTKVQALVDQHTKQISDAMAAEDAELTKKLAAGGMVVTEPSKADLAEAEKRITPYWKEWGEKRPAASRSAAKSARRRRTLTVTALSKPPALDINELDSADADEFSPPEGHAARACRFVSEWIVVGLVVMMGAEMLVRSLFGWSIQFSNEIGGYALVAITFLSARFGTVAARLSPCALRRGKDVARRPCVAAACLRLRGPGCDGGAARRTGPLRVDHLPIRRLAATSLMTPQWIPRLVMPIGTLVLAWALLRTVASDWRRVRAASNAKAA